MPEERSQEQERLGLDQRIGESEDAEIIRFEEEASVRPEGWRGAGFLRARTKIETVRVTEPFEQSGEELDVERQAAEPTDPGGVLTLPDGGVSVPIYEEELVVSKRVVLKERLVIRKRVVTASTPVEAELRRERVELDIDDGISDRVSLPDGRQPSKHERSSE